MLIGRSRHEARMMMLHPGTSNSPAKLFDVAKIQNEIGHMKSAVLFAHAVSGGDKTSAIFGKGKKKAYKLLQKDESLRQEVVDIFCSPTSSREDVCRAGEKFVRALYPSGKSLENIDNLRLHLYNRTIARQSVAAQFDLATLPPTRAAVQQHSLRTYLQVQEWLDNDLNPIDWGWRTSGDTLMPVTTTLAPAPDSLLRLIACECKTDCAARCGCRRSGQQCSEMCLHCLGQNCTNAHTYEMDPDDPEPLDL